MKHCLKGRLALNTTNDLTFGLDRNGRDIALDEAMEVFFASLYPALASGSMSHAMKAGPLAPGRAIEKKAFVIRLLPQVSETLRARARTHGDLSKDIESAIANADLEQMNLVPLGGRPPRSGPLREKVVKATTVSLLVATYDTIGHAAQIRRKSMNVIINSALLWWLERTPSSTAKRKRSAPDDTDTARRR